MNKELAFNYLKLRIIVGTLGEKLTPRWWNTSFLDATSSTFLNHIFTRTYHLAQYQGVREAACKTHDDFIGIGEVYHLFRLPEEIEYNLNNFLLNERNKLDEIYIHAQDSNKALYELSQIAEGNKASSTGPVLVGKTSLLKRASNIPNLAQFYWGAFSANDKTFPYFSD